VARAEGAARPDDGRLDVAQDGVHPGQGRLARPPAAAAGPDHLVREARLGQGREGVQAVGDDLGAGRQGGLGIAPDLGLGKALHPAQVDRARLAVAGRRDGGQERELVRRPPPAPAALAQLPFAAEVSVVDHAAELAAARAEAERARGEVERLRLVIKALQRHRFGRRAETLDPDQLALALEDLEQTVAAAEAVLEGPTADGPRPEGARASRRSNRGALPAHLPREEVVVDPEDKACPCCGGAMRVIGEDVAERLDVTPARFKVLVTRRPKYACHACQEGVAQATAPPRLVAGGLPTERLVAHVLVAKYADHLPLYRQAQIYARQGVALDRSTLADWVGLAAFALRPVHARLLEVLKASTRLFADETTAPVLDPGRGRTKTGQLWAYARDDRPWGGPQPPGVAFVYAPDRKGERPAAHLAGFAEVLQVDGYAGYAGLAAGGRVTLAFCWSHARRLFYEIHVYEIHAGGTPAPIAAEALARIARLYKLKAEIRGRSAEEQCRVRRARAGPILAALKPWLEARLAAVSAKSATAEAIRYALARWDGLTRYLDDGRIEIDSNAVERTMRPVALGRKNHLFAGSDGGGEHWAVLASLVGTCKLNGLDPEAYLADVLTRLAGKHPAGRIDELLPWAYVQTAPGTAAAA
jgi:transposase